MGQKFYDESDIQAIAAAIRAKNGSQNTYTVAQMPAAIQAIPSQDNTLIDSLINRNITSIRSTVASVGLNAFYYCMQLINAELPNATILYDYAFYFCQNLITVEIPLVEELRQYAFYSCTRLTAVEFPNLRNIGRSSFQGCTSVTTVNLPKAEETGSYSFAGCSNLRIAEFPKATSVNNYAFSNCSSLTTVILKRRASLQNLNAFNNAPNAIIYVLPEDLTWYSTATYWSTLYAQNRIKSIEELPT